MDIHLIKLIFLGRHFIFNDDIFLWHCTYQHYIYIIISVIPKDPHAKHWASFVHHVETSPEYLFTNFILLFNLFTKTLFSDTWCSFSPWVPKVAVQSQNRHQSGKGSDLRSFGNLEHKKHHANIRYSICN